MGREEQIIEERIKKIKELKKIGINPYPNGFNTNSNSIEIQKKHSDLKPESFSKDNVKLAGRILTIRDMGKIAFAPLLDGSGKIQIVLQENETPEKVLDFFKKFVDSGDFIGIEGIVFRTKRGELSVLVKKLEILTKSILPLPEKWHGIQDDEERLRKRYLDIIVNPEIKNMFFRKAKFWQTIRDFLIKRGFLEVETPALETSAGGASATPFATHHNALNMDVYLRISMGELWQKKLMVAGYTKTFEIGRQFRNEGMDAEHLQDYTQMEFYWAYANYEQGMELVEEMYKEIAKEVYGTTKFKIGEFEFDLGKKWGRIDYGDTIKKETGIDIFKATDLEIKKKLDELKVEYDRAEGRSSLIDSLWKYCRRKIAGPVFLIGTPVDVSPLAKRDPSDPRKVERFQPIIAGSEVGNGYSELNDPFDQEERFKEQQKMKDSGDNEAQSHDFEFVEALKYGMPPTCGFGVSERLFAFLEGKPIRETVIFPLMKPIKSEKSETKTDQELKIIKPKKEKNDRINNKK
jgi:lysyl-tRNA synthetase, class II